MVWIGFRGIMKLIWESIPFAVCWSIWLARNDLVFSRTQTSWEKVKEVSLLRMATWIKAKSMNDLFTYEDFRYNIEGVRSLQVKRKVYFN